MDFIKPYDREAWLNFLEDSFLPEDFRREETILSLSEKYNYAQEVIRLGECRLLELTVFEVKHVSTNDPRARVGLSKDAFKIICNYTQFNRALIFFVPQSDNSRYRFSLATMDIALKDEQSGKTKRIFSNPRRFSYMLGENCKQHTPQTMLDKKGRAKDFPDLQSRFAIDVVTKKFYQELFNWYDTWAINMVKFPVGEGVAAGLPKNPDVEANRQHLIRLITRLIFVWFLKQKDNLIPEWIFKENDIAGVLKSFEPHSDKKGNYYNGIIQNLFFATLNKEITKRDFTNEANSKEHYGIKTFYRDHSDAKRPADNSLFKISQDDFIKKFETVPFLNGGLFECLDRREGSEKQKYVDGFSREKSRAAFVPNCLFFGDGGGREGIIDLFSRYNFTVEENTPQDIDIALDPELLGKVFENLLGTYNEETKSTARNESGSFYTPREIVDYMVDTSLKEYFKGKITNNDKYTEAKLDRLFSYHETAHDFSDNEVTTLMNAIHQCKILDPACGSGAFPMGILNKLTFIMEKLDRDNKQWEEIQIQKAKEETEEAYRSGNKEQRDGRIKEISDVFELSTGAYANYARKLFLIENCIFGIDIQPIAIQISKLRFFISLIVDQKTGGTKENNYNVLPLPNLETKFVAANTLIGVKREQGVLADPDIEKKQQKLLIIRHKHFSARKADEKNNLRKQDVELSKELAALLKKDGFCNSADAEKMANWNPYDQTRAVDFFDAYWMFGIKDGFDVVIGNPPYISHDQLNDGDYYKTVFSDVWSPFADIYCYFIKQGLLLLKRNSILAFITSNSYIKADYGALLRNFVGGKNTIYSLINIEVSQIFSSAIVNTAILIARSGEHIPSHKTLVTNSPLFDLNIEEYIEKNSFYAKASRFAEAKWILEKEIVIDLLNKLKKSGITIKEHGAKIRLGIATGDNKAFLLTEQERLKFISKNNKNGEIIKPILRGRDIYQYTFIKPHEYVILSKNGIDLPNDYPDLARHLETFGDKFKKRGAKGKFWWNLRACDFYDDFKKEKIVWIELTDKGRFAICKDEIYCINSAYFMIPPSMFDSRFLTGLLNSKLILFFVKNHGETSGMGTVRWINNVVADIPIPNISLSKQQKILDFVEKITFAKTLDLQADTYILERQIDNLVYHLYNLTYDEVKIIEPEFPLTKAEYERLDGESEK